MKKALFASVVGSLLLAVSTFAQGTVTFVNSSATRVMQNDNGTVVPAPATTGLLLGLYYGVEGAAEGSLKLAAYLTSNGASTTTILAAAPGRFAASEAVKLTDVAGGARATLQVRAWTAANGSTYEQAATASSGYLGKSALFTITTGNSSPTDGPKAITGAGGLTSFEVAPVVVPEPTTLAFGALGLGAAILLRRRSSK